MWMSEKEARVRKSEKSFSRISYGINNEDILLSWGKTTTKTVYSTVLIRISISLLSMVVLSLASHLCKKAMSIFLWIFFSLIFVDLSPLVFVGDFFCHTQRSFFLPPVLSLFLLILIRLTLLLFLKGGNESKSKVKDTSIRWEESELEWEIQ